MHVIALETVIKKVRISVELMLHDNRINVAWYSRLTEQKLYWQACNCTVFFFLLSFRECYKMYCTVLKDNKIMRYIFMFYHTVVVNGQTQSVLFDFFPIVYVFLYALICSFNHWTPQISPLNSVSVSCHQMACIICRTKTSVRVNTKLGKSWKKNLWGISKMLTSS